MSGQTMTFERTFHIERRGAGARKEMEFGPVPQLPIAIGRVPRVSRFMALAIRLDGLVRDGVITNYVELARLSQVTRARVSQILSLVYLAPDIQEQVLFLPKTERGRDPIILRDLLPIAAVKDWHQQRQQWSRIARPGSNAIDGEK